MKLKFGQLIGCPGAGAEASKKYAGLVKYQGLFRGTGCPAFDFQKGMPSVRIADAPDGPRRGFLAIFSTAYKYGSEATPWYDIFDETNGTITYHGDNKPGG